MPVHESDRTRLLQVITPNCESVAPAGAYGATPFDGHHAHLVRTWRPITVCALIAAAAMSLLLGVQLHAWNDPASGADGSATTSKFSLRSTPERLLWRSISADVTPATSVTSAEIVHSEQSPSNWGNHQSPADIGQWLRQDMKMPALAAAVVDNAVDGWALGNMRVEDWLQLGATSGMQAAKLMGAWEQRQEQQSEEQRTHEQHTQTRPGASVSTATSTTSSPNRGDGTTTRPANPHESPSQSNSVTCAGRDQLGNACPPSYNPDQPCPPGCTAVPKSLDSSDRGSQESPSENEAQAQRGGGRTHSAGPSTGGSLNTSRTTAVSRRKAAPSSSGSRTAQSGATTAKGPSVLPGPGQVSSTLANGTLVPRFHDAPTLSMVQKQGDSEDCPSGYTEELGDIAGWGNMHGSESYTDGVATVMSCAELCFRDPACLSFEYSVSGDQAMRCSLNDAAHVVTVSASRGNTVFCRKGNHASA